MMAVMDAPIVTILLPVAAYLMGSIPFGLLIGRLATGKDIRKGGSGNIGATNVSRLAGARWGLLTLALDAAKGAAPTWAAVYVYGDGFSWLPAATILGAVCGHMFPLYLGFKASGKGVATAAGCFLAAAPTACLAALLTFIATVRWTRRVSAGSLTATIALPPAIWFSTHDTALALSGMAVMVLVLSRHEDNIRRLASGREQPWSGLKK